jgi:hypothetical protein
MNGSGSIGGGRGRDVKNVDRRAVMSYPSSVPARRRIALGGGAVALLLRRVDEFGLPTPRLRQAGVLSR